MKKKVLAEDTEKQQCLAAQLKAEELEIANTDCTGLYSELAIAPPSTTKCVRSRLNQDP